MLTKSVWEWISGGWNGTTVGVKSILVLSLRWNDNCCFWFIDKLFIWGLFNSLKFFCLSLCLRLINLFVSPIVMPGCCKISWESHSVLVWSKTSDCQTLKFVPFCWYCCLSMTFSLCSSLLCFLLGKVWWWKSLQVRILLYVHFDGKQSLPFFKMSVLQKYL